MSEPTPKRPLPLSLLVPAGLVLAALVVRAALWSTQSEVSTEGALSIMAARVMGMGIPWENQQSIGYPLLIRIFDALGMSAMTAARAIDLIAGLAAVVLTWSLTRRWVQPLWLAALPALAVAGMPLTVRYSLGTQPDMLYLALVLGAVTVAAGGRYWLGGILMGVAAQVRPEALVVLAGMIFLVRSRRGATPLAGGAALAFGLLWAMQGMLLQSWSVFPQVVQQVHTHWLDRELTEAPAAPAFLGRVGALVRHTLSFGGWWVPLLGLAALRRRAPWVAVALLPVVVSPFIHYGGHPRFVLEWLPFLWILAAVFAAGLKPALRAGTGVLCVAGFALTAWHHAPQAYTLQEDGSYPELQRAGAFLKNFTRADVFITGSLPQAAVYAQGQYRALPPVQDDYHTAVDAIVESGADFAVFHQQALHKAYPALTPLVEDKAVVWHEYRLEPVYFDDSYMDGRTLVYRVVRPGGLGPLPTEGRDMRRQIGNIPHGKDHEFHGELTRMAKKFDTCASEYLLASNRNPGTPESAFALNNRAWCLLQHGEYDKAKTESFRAIEILPHQEEFIDTMIEIVRAMGQDRAVEYWQGKLEEARQANAAAAVDSPEER